jgi:hypothetical protein
MDPTIKQFQVTAGAAEGMGGGKPKGRTRKAKKEPGTVLVGKEREEAPVEKPVVLKQVVAKPVPVPVAVPVAVPVPVPVAVVTPVKVVLAAAKKRDVILAPKALPPAKKTRRAHRSIKVSMAGLSRRMTRAKTIRKDASSLGLPEIKAALQKAGLIKAESKAPETILRQMYADYMMLKDRAL